ncbi:testis-expressed protein 44 [Vombatus ursinus]|uniref:testis-expressed protein 44 n=1 Tax=Vombatus ursinus TaxID=29139 RepID=UPI000FFD0A59|nr:testis-expressed protein 44 [Vombatus ursinus]
MSSTSLQNSGAAVSTENENPETTLNNSNALDQQSLSLTQSDDELSQIYRDAGEALTLSKSQDFSEDDTVISNSHLSLLFEREVLPDLSTSQTHNSIACPQVATAPGSPNPPSSTSLIGAEDDNDSYMRSITSLVGGGEGPISSLTDILVWTETAMGTATGLLNASHTSMTDILHSPGTALRSITSLLGEAHNVFASGLFSGTGSVFRRMSQFLGNIERRTVEGIRSVFRFMAHHISPHRNHADNN